MNVQIPIDLVRLLEDAHPRVEYWLLVNGLRPREPARFRTIGIGPARS
jgi:hypothetical protein